MREGRGGDGSVGILGDNSRMFQRGTRGGGGYGGGDGAGAGG